MTAVDLDPLFVKALRLMHSKSKDSTEQLRQMLEDAIAQKRGLSVAKPPVEPEKSSSSKPPLSSSGGSKKDEDGVKRREAEKRHIDKVKQEPSDSSPEVPAKKSRLDTDEKDPSHSRDKHSGKEREKEKERSKKEKESKEKERDKEKKESKREQEKEREKEKLKKEKEKEKQRLREKEKEKEKEKEREKIKVKEEEVASEEEDMAKSMDADDFALDLGISCIVCKQFDVTSGNQLVECQECHNLYHQECHRPPVIEQDVNDPRFVWYCSRCEKTMKKMVSKPQKNKPPPAPVEKEKPAPAVQKPVKTEPAPSLFSFRREPKQVGTSKDTSSHGAAKPLSGLASLAANLSGQSKSTSKSDPSKSGPKSSDLSKLGSAVKSEPTEKSGSATSYTKERTKSFSEAVKPFQRQTSEISKNRASPELGKSSKGGDSSKSSSKPSVSSSSSATASSSSSSGKSAQGGSSSVANADKRLQLMKKKAAAKLQEKRSSVK